ncbi:MAG TPA: GNAT family N-acetyltransferase [Chthonomonadaceae bacterium]|nr:GNAT family N-acetyltransferase [Chthonomonadaceae bacterium]
MKIEVRTAEYADIEPLRGLYRLEAGCQIVHDSILGRGMGDPYLILADGRIAGYGGVWTRYDPGRIMEFYALPAFSGSVTVLYRELIEASGATEAEAQTNMPRMLTALCDFATDIKADNILFHDGETTRLTCAGAHFRRRLPEDECPDHDADWVIEANGEAVASGGFLCHYNPPYGDIYMAVRESKRRMGYGSYLVQELKRVCYEAGKRPSARCSPDNLASRRTLERAGMHVCGRLLSGRIRKEG